jgi:hypothetical protein
MDLTDINSFSYEAFAGCTISSLIIRRTDKVPTLAHTNSMGTNGSGVCGSGRYIYVPAALVDTYKATTNWSSYADKIRALEDYTIDGTTTGELDESKI